MLGNATKIVWNAVDPRPVYRKVVGAATSAAKYESFDTSGIRSSLFSTDLSGVGKGAAAPSSSSILPTFGNPTYTPIPDFSGQSMQNIVFTCSNLTTSPPGPDLTPAQLQARETNIGLCKANGAYFCKYIQDSSANFTPDQYATLTKMYCSPSAGTKTLVSVASGLGVTAIIAYIGFFIGALLTASVVANQMLYMPALMRIFVFLIIFAISVINPFIMGVILLYYLFVIGLDVFRNVKGIKGMNQFIIPATLLPIWLRRPNQGLLARIFTAPFTYIEPDRADPGLQDYMSGAETYVNGLQRAAKLTEEDLKSAKMVGMKEEIVKDLKSGVEAMLALAAGVAGAAGAEGQLAVQGVAVSAAAAEGQPAVPPAAAVSGAMPVAAAGEQAAHNADKLVDAAARQAAYDAIPTGGHHRNEGRYG